MKSDVIAAVAVILLQACSAPVRSENSPIYTCPINRFPLPEPWIWRTDAEREKSGVGGGRMLEAPAAQLAADPNVTGGSSKVYVNISACRLGDQDLGTIHTTPCRRIINAEPMLNSNRPYKVLDWRGLKLTPYSWFFDDSHDFIGYCTGGVTTKIFRGEAPDYTDSICYVWRAEPRGEAGVEITFDAELFPFASRIIEETPRFERSGAIRCRYGEDR